MDVGNDVASRIEVDDIFKALQADGYRTILTEGGPQLFGRLVASDRVDELFLTVSPVVAGQKCDRSFGLVHGVDFGRTPQRSSLLSVRRHESHLFLRFDAAQKPAQNRYVAWIDAVVLARPLETDRCDILRRGELRRAPLFRDVFCHRLTGPPSQGHRP